MRFSFAAVALGAALLASCGAKVIAPGKVPAVGPEEGLVLVKVWDPSCKEQRTPAVRLNTVATTRTACDFDGWSIELERVLGAHGDTERAVNHFSFDPQYQLLVLPVGVWKMTSVSSGNTKGSFFDNALQFRVVPGVISNWGILVLAQNGGGRFQYGLGESSPEEAQSYVNTSWPNANLRIAPGIVEKR